MATTAVTEHIRVLDGFTEGPWRTMFDSRFRWVKPPSVVEKFLSLRPVTITYRFDNCGRAMSYEEKPHHRRYYMLSEVAQHCTPEDCWMTWFGDVYDLSPLLQQHQGASRCSTS